MRAENSVRESRFTELYSAHVDEVYRFFYLRCGMDSAVAEDLTQDVFVEVFRGLGLFEERSSARTWVFSIARHKLNDFYRRSCRDMLKSESLEEAQPADPSQDLEQNQLRSFKQESVRASLAALPEKYALVLTLKYIDGKSVKEIARLAGGTPKAAESLLGRARSAFIKCYDNIAGRES